MPIPNGWKVDPNNPDLYKARDKIDGRYIEYVLNVRTGNNTANEYRAPDGTGAAARNFEPRDLFSYNADDDIITYQDDSFKKILESNTEKLSIIKNTLPERANEINKELSQTEDSGITSKDRDELLEKPKFQEIQDTQSSDAEDSKPTEPFNAADNIANLGITSKIKRKINGFNLTYPLTEKGKNQQTQDYVQFDIGKYSPKSLKLDPEKTNLGQLSERGNNLTETYGTISLPIQPSIVDSNSVDWNENNLNPLRVAALQSTIDIANNFNLERITDAAKNTIDSNDGSLSKIGKLLIAQKAVGASNVISRFGGGIVNPNMELLFNGPQLRPFNFNFRLSPRNKNEADEVRQIIRQFKQSMAVKVSSNGLFLAAPDIFKIRYLRKDQSDHPSLNKIKLCALKSCNVDYTPENSYMTFNDNFNTMVSYNLSLQFQELDPITDADYDNTDSIGY